MNGFMQFSFILHTLYIMYSFTVAKFVPHEKRMQFGHTLF